MRLFERASGEEALLTEGLVVLWATEYVSNESFRVIFAVEASVSNIRNRCTSRLGQLQRHEKVTLTTPRSKIRPLRRREPRDILACRLWGSWVKDSELYSFNVTALGCWCWRIQFIDGDFNIHGADLVGAGVLGKGGNGIQARKVGCQLGRRRLGFVVARHDAIDGRAVLQKQRCCSEGHEIISLEGRHRQRKWALEGKSVTAALVACQG